MIYLKKILSVVTIDIIYSELTTTSGSENSSPLFKSPLVASKIPKKRHRHQTRTYTSPPGVIGTPALPSLKSPAQLTSAIPTLDLLANQRPASSQSSLNNIPTLYNDPNTSSSASPILSTPSQVSDSNQSEVPDWIQHFLSQFPDDVFIGDESQYTAALRFVDDRLQKALSKIKNPEKLHQDQLHVLLGPENSGKSTFAKLLTSLYKIKLSQEPVPPDYPISPHYLLFWKNLSPSHEKASTCLPIRNGTWMRLIRGSLGASAWSIDIATQLIVYSFLCYMMLWQIKNDHSDSNELVYDVSYGNWTNDPITGPYRNVLDVTPVDYPLNDWEKIGRVFDTNTFMGKMYYLIFVYLFSLLGVPVASLAKWALYLVRKRVGPVQDSPQFIRGPYSNKQLMGQGDRLGALLSGKFISLETGPRFKETKPGHVGTISTLDTALTSGTILGFPTRATLLMELSSKDTLSNRQRQSGRLVDKFQLSQLHDMRNPTTQESLRQLIKSLTRNAFQKTNHFQAKVFKTVSHFVSEEDLKHAIHTIEKFLVVPNLLNLNSSLPNHPETLNHHFIFDGSIKQLISFALYKKVKSDGSLHLKDCLLFAKHLLFRPQTLDRYLTQLDELFGQNKIMPSFKSLQAKILTQWQEEKTKIFSKIPVSFGFNKHLQTLETLLACEWPSMENRDDDSNSLQNFLQQNQTHLKNTETTFIGYMGRLDLLRPLFEILDHYIDGLKTMPLKKGVLTNIPQDPMIILYEESWGGGKTWWLEKLIPQYLSARMKSLNIQVPGLKVNPINDRNYEFVHSLDKSIRSTVRMAFICFRNIPWLLTSILYGCCIYATDLYLFTKFTTIYPNYEGFDEPNTDYLDLQKLSQNETLYQYQTRQSPFNTESRHAWEAWRKEIIFSALLFTVGNLVSILNIVLLWVIQKTVNNSQPRLLYPPSGQVNAITIPGSVTRSDLVGKRDITKRPQDQMGPNKHDNWHLFRNPIAYTFLENLDEVSATEQRDIRAQIQSGEVIVDGKPLRKPVFTAASTNKPEAVQTLEPISQLYAHMTASIGYKDCLPPSVIEALEATANEKELKIEHLMHLEIKKQFVYLIYTKLRKRLARSKPTPLNQTKPSSPGSWQLPTFSQVTKISDKAIDAFFNFVADPKTQELFIVRPLLNTVLDTATEIASIKGKDMIQREHLVAAFRKDIETNNSAEWIRKNLRKIHNGTLSASPDYQEDASES